MLTAIRERIVCFSEIEETLVNTLSTGNYDDL